MEKTKKSEEAELEEIVGSSGEVTLYSGGYEITVKDPKKFKWDKVFQNLFAYGFSVYVIDKEGKINIVAKQIY